MRKTHLHEGVKIGFKEQEVILNHSDDFNIGIEYEFHYGNLEFNQIEALVSDDVELSVEFVNRFPVRRSIDDGIDDGHIEQYSTYESLSESLTDNIQGINLINVAPGTFLLIFSNQNGLDTKETTYLYDQFREYQTIDYFFDLIHRLSDISDDYYSISELISAILNSTEMSQTEIKGKQLINTIIEDLYDSNAIKDNYLDITNDTILNSDNTISKAVPALNDLTDNFINPYLEGNEIDDSSFENKIRETSKIIISESSWDYDLIEQYLENSSETSEYFSYSRKGTPQNIAEKYGITYDIIVADESGNGQVEIITSKMNVVDGLKHIRKVMEMIRNEEIIYTSDNSGMHISISSKKYNLDNFNVSKFISLIEYNYIDNIFPSRDNVDNIIDALKSSEMTNRIIMFLTHNDYNSKEFIEEVKCSIENSRAITRFKEQSIKFADYRKMNGRIELRFFGGKNYENRFDDVKEQLLRSLYLLSISYTDEYNIEYHKSLYRLVNDIIQSEMGIDLPAVEYIKKISKKYKDEERVIETLENKGIDISDSDVKVLIHNFTKSY